MVKCIVYKLYNMPESKKQTVEEMKRIRSQEVIAISHILTNISILIVPLKSCLKSYCTRKRTASIKNNNISDLKTTSNNNKNIYSLRSVIYHVEAEVDDLQLLKKAESYISIRFGSSITSASEKEKKRGEGGGGGINVPKVYEIIDSEAMPYQY